MGALVGKCEWCGEPWNRLTGFLVGQPTKHKICPICFATNLKRTLRDYGVHHHIEKKRGAKVLVLEENRRIPGQGSKWVRREKRWALYARDGWRCLYCTSRALDGVTLSLDHFRPVSRGESPTEPGNILTMCVPCNSARQAMPVRAFADYLADRGYDPARIMRRIARHRTRKFDPTAISPRSPRARDLEARMDAKDWAATVSRLLEGVQSAGRQEGTSAALAIAGSAAAHAELIRGMGCGSIEGVQAALLARQMSAATGRDVGLEVADKLLVEAPAMLPQETWMEEFRGQRETELAMLLDSLTE